MRCASRAHDTTHDSAHPVRVPRPRIYDVCPRSEPVQTLAATQRMSLQASTLGRGAFVFSVFHMCPSWRKAIACHPFLGDTVSLKLHAAGAQADSEARREARQVVQEVWEVVDQNYLDARVSGFDRARWAAVGPSPSVFCANKSLASNTGMHTDHVRIAVCCHKCVPFGCTESAVWAHTCA